MLTKKSPKNPLHFECEKCAYVTSNKKDYTKHLTTAKHKKIINGNNLTPEKCRLIFYPFSGVFCYPNIR